MSETILNYFQLKTYSPFSYKVGFLDTVNDTYSDVLFFRHKVKVKQSEIYRQTGILYVYKICKIKKKDYKEFLRCMYKLKRYIVHDLKHPEYERFCSIMMDRTSNLNKSNNYSLILSGSLYNFIK